MASTIPTQERVVDPFASYNSNVVNKITRAITKDENGFLTTNSFQVSLDLILPLTTVVISTGYLIKDDVLINITSEHKVDFNDSDQYYGSPLPAEGGYHYLVIDYTYAKSRPAPKASIKILKPSERAALTTNNSLMLLKVVERATLPSHDIIALYDADPTILQNKREYIKYYAGSEVILPTFEQEGDQSRIAYETTRDKYFFGYSDGWRELAAGGISTDINTDSTSVVVGSLCYVDSNRDAIPAIATHINTGADIVVLSIGTAVSGEGRGSVAGFVEDVPVQPGLGIFVGDLLYLSETHPGTVTNTRTSPYYQVVGRALSNGSVTTPIDMIFSPKLTLSMSVEGRITTWSPEGGGLYSRQIDVSGLDGTNAFDCHWFDATTHYEIRPADVEILQNGDRIKVWMSTDTIDVDYIISSGGGAGAAGAGGGGGVTDHALLTGLHYAVSGHTGFAPSPHGNAHHSQTYIEASDVSFANLNANGDVGIGALQVAFGNHTHPGYIDVPSGAVLLFESDTAISGYTLLTTQDDMVVYITKGSAAGGESGGTSKGGGTWTQPNHSHGISNEAGHIHTTMPHTLTIAEMPTHRHWVAQFAAWASGPPPTSFGGIAAPTSNLYTDYQGGSQPHDHGNTGSGGSHNHGGTTGGDNTASSWRPRGYNYTRQRRI